MARCSCAGSSCSCLIQSGAGVDVQGTGTSANPYVLSATSNFYTYTFASGGPVYYVNRESITDVGSRAVFLFEVNPSVTAMVYMPDGSINAPYPVLGAEIEMSFTSDPTGVIAWQGGVITWHGVAPTGNKMGWYRFTYVGDRFLGVYLGATYTP